MYLVRVPGVDDQEKNSGCEKAGNEVIAALKEIHTNERNVPIDVRMFDLEEIHVDNSNPDLKHDLIYKNSLKNFENKPKTIVLGGDQSISYPMAKAFLDYCGREDKEPCLIVLDSHPDCSKSEPNSKHPSSEEWVRAIVEEGFPSENVFLVGIRNSLPEEISFMEKKSIKRMNLDQMLENLDDSCDILMEFSKGKQTYISIDLSVVDPAFAPGTKHGEPAGLTSRQIIYLIKRLNQIRTLRIVDLVEINPDKDPEKLTIKLGAKILSELA